MQGLFHLLDEAHPRLFSGVVHIVKLAPGHPAASAENWTHRAHPEGAARVAGKAKPPPRRAGCGDADKAADITQDGPRTTTRRCRDLESDARQPDPFEPSFQHRGWAKIPSGVDHD